MTATATPAAALNGTIDDITVAAAVTDHGVWLSLTRDGSVWPAAGADVTASGFLSADEMDELGVQFHRLATLQRAATPDGDAA